MIIRRAYLLLIFLNISSLIQAKQDSYIYKVGDNDVEHSIVFKRLRDKKILFSHNKDRLLVPASVSKLFSSAALLKKLGSKFVAKTNFYYTGIKQKTTISGALVIVGGGDAHFVSEDLWHVAKKLKQSGYRFFKGDLIIDSKSFSVRQTKTLDSKERSSRPYCARSTAMGLNFNTHKIVILPPKSIGAKANIVLDPYPYQGTRIINKVVATKGKTNLVISLVRSKKTNQQTIVVKGRINIKSKPQERYLSAAWPLYTSGSIIKSFLSAQGVNINGRVKIATVGKNKKFIFSHDSEPLQDLVKYINVYSNNFMTHVLTCQLGVELLDQAKESKQNPCSIGMSAINGFIRKDLGIKTKYSLFSPSGLSKKNLLSSQQVVNLLEYMAQDFSVFPEFLNSLPKPGHAGTLFERFTDKNMQVFKEQIRAKTGSLSTPVAVSSLAGYFSHKDHGIIAFSIIQNGRRNRKQPLLSSLQKRQDVNLSKFYKNL
jgi:serine-type D-Ala-D-Ala carboxypeptidase/endopeptidase (penicillin-binding protein 4)